MCSNLTSSPIGGCVQAEVLSLVQHQQAVDNADPESERSDEPVRDLFDGRGPMGGLSPDLHKLLRPSAPRSEPPTSFLVGTS